MILRSFPGHRRWQSWALLLALSVLLSVLLDTAGLPAALLLGPMAAGITLAASGLAAGNRAIAIPRPCFELAQAAVGTVVAAQIPPEILPRILSDWPIFLGGVVSVIVVASWLGYLLARRQVLPGTTAVWGASPGAAQAMIFLAEAHGADMRLVAVMQYLRVGMIAASASILARMMQAEAAPPVPVTWFPSPDAGLAAGLAVMALGLGVTRLLKISGGSFLMPLLIGAALKGAGILDPVLPDWLPAVAYATIGWMIGLRFTRAILAHAARALPRLAVSIILLMGLCSLMAAALVVFAGIDPLTAYLATSPGGADSIAIIAASSNVDLSFVMAMQTLRFMIVLATGPVIARAIARRLDLGT